MSKRSPVLDGLRPVTRWYPASKRALIESVEAGACDLDEALRRHGIARAEYDRWVELYRRDGVQGLRTRQRYAGGLVAEIPVPVAQGLPSKGWRRPRRESTL